MIVCVLDWVTVMAPQDVPAGACPSGPGMLRVALVEKLAAPDAQLAAIHSPMAGTTANTFLETDITDALPINGEIQRIAEHPHTSVASRQPIDGISLVHGFNVVYISHKPDWRAL